MSTSIEPAVATREGSEVENLGLLHIAVERKHDRPSALRRRVAATWQDTPDWRFHRQVIRMALYLHERAQVGPRDRVALVSGLGPEWSAMAWAALTRGAAIGFVDPALSDGDIASHLLAFGPRVVFAPDAVARRIAARRVPGVEAVIAYGGESQGDGVVTWTEALDLGGSLDTAERANAFRAHAKGVSPDAPAIGYAAGSNGSIAWRFLSQQDVVRRVQRIWARARVANGDVAYLAGVPPTVATAAELLAFTADGYTQVIFGNAGQELEEIAMARPHKVVASPDAVRRLLQSMPPGEPSRVRRWLARSPVLAKRLRLERDRWELPTAMGRVRWISTGPSLEFAVRARARRFVTLEIDDSLA